MDRRAAIELGLALGLVMGLAIVVGPLGQDDFSRVLWPVGRGGEPYQAGRLFWYPIWNVLLLRAWALLPRMAGLVLIWVIDVGVVLWASRLWRTPAWVTLISPPFVFALLYGHPWEAFFLAGLSLAIQGWRSGRDGLVALGLCLMAFKPQLAVVPGLLLVLGLSCKVQGRKWLLGPVGLVIISTGLDLALTGRLWLVPFFQALGRIGQESIQWNASLWLAFSWANLTWLPVAGCLLWQGRKGFLGNLERELWIATALGFLVGPYWGAYSLWPLVTMAGCLIKKGEV